MGMLLENLFDRVSVSFGMPKANAAHACHSYNGKAGLQTVP
jgi:hypothetical protein